jgi:hypothetical protein
MDLMREICVQLGCLISSSDKLSFAELNLPRRFIQYRQSPVSCNIHNNKFLFSRRIVTAENNLLQSP